MNYLSGKLYENTDSFLKICLFMSYQTQFPCFENTNVNSDIGWGCTIRTAQMLLANTLLHHVLHDLEPVLSSQKMDIILQNLLTDFNDTHTNLFSIHQFIKYYPQIGKKIYQWCGPCSICQLLEYLAPTMIQKYGITLLHNLPIQQIVPYKFTTSSFMVLFSIRIAIHTLNTLQQQELLRIMRIPQFIGIIGGCHKSSYYFPGYSKKASGKVELLYLDPHICQSYQSNINIQKYKITNLKVLDLHKLNPSLAAGFYCSNYLELEKLYNFLEGSSIIDIITHELPIQSKKDDDWEILC